MIFVVYSGSRLRVIFGQNRVKIDYVDSWYNDRGGNRVWCGGPKI